MSQAPTPSETPIELFDVVIFDMETRKVESVVGKALRKNTGHYNAERRLESAFNRINLDRYRADIVPAGKYEVGSVLPESCWPSPRSYCWQLGWRS